MSDLADLAFDVAGDLPAPVRKVIDTAVANGWELNAPGLTLALRLNHPTDELAAPVYITWAVGRTSKGAMSFRFMSCATAALQPLKAVDLLEYLADPTVAYSTPEELEDDLDAKAKQPPWDLNATPEVNVMRQLGGTPVSIDGERQATTRRKTAQQIIAEAKEKSSQGLRVQAPPLRVKAP